MFPVLFRDRMSPSDVRHLDGPTAVVSLSEFPLQRLLRLPPVCPVHHPHRFRPLRLQLSMARTFSLSPNRCGQSFFSRFSISLPPFPGRTFPFGYVNPGRDSGWNKGGLLLRSEEQNIMSVFLDSQINSSSDMIGYGMYGLLVARWLYFGLVILTVVVYYSYLFLKNRRNYENFENL